MGDTGLFVFPGVMANAGFTHVPVLAFFCNNSFLSTERFFLCDGAGCEVVVRGRGFRSTFSWRDGKHGISPSSVGVLLTHICSGPMGRVHIYTTIQAF